MREPPQARPARGPLGELVAEVALRKPQPLLGDWAPAGVAASGKPAAQAAPEPRTLRFFQRTWSRLSADQRLAQSQAALPGNAGPLNSQHLVHRSLMLMREVSPEYLEHFVGYIDALQWLEQSDEAAARPAGAGRAMPARR